RPDKYESGTLNTPGIAGLYEGVQMVLAETPHSIYEREWELTQRLISELSEMGKVFVLGPHLGKPRSGLVSFLLPEFDAAEVAFALDREYGIAVRSGYHCTPLGHETAGTLKTGAV